MLCPQILSPTRKVVAGTVAGLHRFKSTLRDSMRMELTGLLYSPALALHQVGGIQVEKLVSLQCIIEVHIHEAREEACKSSTNVKLLWLNLLYFKTIQNISMRISEYEPHHVSLESHSKTRESSSIPIICFDLRLQLSFEFFSSFCVFPQVTRQLWPLLC